MSFALLEARSFRFLIASSMFVALVPIAISAVGGYFLLNNGVIASFQDVAVRQRTEIIPTQRLRLVLMDALVPVDEFVENGNPVHQRAYRDYRTQIETEFANLAASLKGERQTQEVVQRAQAEWTAADRLATQLISVSTRTTDGQTDTVLEQFHGAMAAASDKLGSVYDQLESDVLTDHDVAVLFYERSIWLAGIAGAVSLLALVYGISMIGRIMAASVDRLVDGAARFANGDRDHRIEIRIPPEFHRVAEEFNRMISRIRESESLLAELAQRDGLTGLSNRRAFDDALTDLWGRIQRYDEHGALLSIDVDHFKQINDRYGHAAGDDVLRAIARTMVKNLRPGDKVFRVGGEEFAILLPKTDHVAASQTAERLRQEIAANRIRFRDIEISATVSVGIASTSDAAESGAFLEAADAALYRAKADGRNRVVTSGG